MQLESLFNEDNRIKEVLIGILAFIVFILFSFVVYYVTSRYISGDGFKSDVENTYINNLFETGRFSAVPVFKVSIIHFIIISGLVFCILKRTIRSELKTRFFMMVNGAALIYIVFIGFMYIHKWAEMNISEYGEYLTNFNKYMIVAVAVIYFYWGAEVVHWLKQLRDFDKKTGENAR